MDGDLARVIVDDVPAGDEESCREAAEHCPVDAIIIDE
jgi:ferredoxin